MGWGVALVVFGMAGIMYVVMHQKVRAAELREAEERGRANGLAMRVRALEAEVSMLRSKEGERLRVLDAEVRRLRHRTKWLTLGALSHNVRLFLN